MRRLYLQIYLTFVGILLLFGVLVAITHSLSTTDAQSWRTLDGVGALLGELLPGPERPMGELQAAVERPAARVPRHPTGAAVERLAQRFPVPLTVRGADGALLAAVGVPLPAPPPTWTKSGWLHSLGVGPTIGVVLPDGRWVVARWLHQGGGLGWLLVPGLLAV